MKKLIIVMALLSVGCFAQDVEERKTRAANIEALVKQNLIIIVGENFLIQRLTQEPYSHERNAQIHRAEINIREVERDNRALLRELDRAKK